MTKAELTPEQQELRREVLSELDKASVLFRNLSARDTLSRLKEFRAQLDVAINDFVAKNGGVEACQERLAKFELRKLAKSKICRDEMDEGIADLEATINKAEEQLDSFLTIEE